MCYAFNVIVEWKQSENYKFDILDHIIQEWDMFNNQGASTPNNMNTNTNTNATSLTGNPFAKNNNTSGTNVFGSSSQPQGQTAQTGQTGQGFLTNTPASSGTAKPLQFGQPSSGTSGGVGNQGSPATTVFSMFNNNTTNKATNNATNNTISTTGNPSTNTPAGTQPTTTGVNNLFNNTKPTGGGLAQQPLQPAKSNMLFSNSNPMSNAQTAQQAATQPVNPLAGTGSNPLAGTGSNPLAGIGSNPLAGTGSNPLAGKGSNPLAGIGSNPLAGIGSNPLANNPFKNPAGTSSSTPSTPSTSNFPSVGTPTATVTPTSTGLDLFKNNKQNQTSAASTAPTGAAGLNMSQNLSNMPGFQKKPANLAQQNKPTTQSPTTMFPTNNTTQGQNQPAGTTTPPAANVPPTSGGMTFKMAETVVNPQVQPTSNQTGNQPGVQPQQTRETLTQKLAHQYEMTHRTCGQYADLWRNTLIKSYQQIRTQCNILKSYEVDRKENYNIIKNFNQLEPVISQNKKITNLMLEGIQNRQNQIMAILNGIKEEFGSDYNSRYVREHPVTMHLRDCREIRKEINMEEEKQTTVQDEDASNQQLKNIFFNLDSVENQIRRLTHVMDHYFGKIV